ncbi:outer membrane protein assembly factor BamB family protein [Halobacterium salinarum]|uniref:PQQ repeat protein n=1 Tax=Halobacterium salinarum (strain ATCC 29341 / DSM 671 / R1) TaxID=478009 RepID=B0R994_HALS3|nr:PQQ-binding-like beta-propeller repeat protein [Halobacterium salinarum]CAP15399.1 PQQ repeat protein [Halobacterium salinarum R1]
MSGDHEYVRRTSFETGTIDDMSVAEDHVALLAESTVYLVGEDHDQIALDERGEYVALNDKLFVYTDGRVEAYALSGTRLWSADVDDVNALAAPNDSDVVVVLTDDERLVGLDAAAGHERFAHDRPDADVATTPEIVCADESLVVAAWSFLSILSPEGETKLRTTLDGAIHGLGVVGDTVVCVMKDDRLLGIDAESGDEQWCHDWDVDRIDPFGRGELLVRTGEGIRAVTPSGDWTSLDLNDGLPVAAASGDPVCVIDGSLVNVYGKVTPGEATVTASVPADAVESTGSSVPVEVENVGDTMTVATVAVEAAGATVPAEPERLTLAPGESERIRVRLVDVEAESVDFAVRVDGDREEEATLPVAGDVSALAVTASPAAVDGDGWLVDVVIDNDADIPIRGVEVSPSGRTRDVLEPGEQWTVTVPLPADDPIVVAAADAERHLDVSVPEHPIDADVRFDDGLILVAVSNDSPAYVTDTVTLSSAALPRDLELEFEGGNGSQLVVAVPPVDAGDVEVSLTSQLLSWTGTVSVPQSAVVGGRDDGVTEQPDQPPRQIPGGQPTNSDAGNPSVADARDEASSDEAYALELDRRFDPEDASVGGLQFEYVDVTNTGDQPKEVAVEAADSPDVTVVVGPGETTSFVRAHAFTSETVEIPSVSVESEDGRRTAPAVEPSVETPEWYCIAGATTTSDGPHLQLKFVNQSRTRVSVSNLSLRSLSFAGPPDQFEVQPRSTEKKMLPLADPAGGRPALLSFDVGADVSSSSEYQTLVHVPDQNRHGLAHVDLVVDEETVLDTAGGTIVVRLRNDGSAALTDLSVAADGDQVQTMLYDSLAVESLAPGESVRHYVDVGNVEDRLNVPLELSTADGTTEVTKLVADRADEAAVRIDRPSLGNSGAAEISVPDRISTGFEAENAE